MQLMINKSMASSVSFQFGMCHCGTPACAIVRIDDDSPPDMVQLFIDHISLDTRERAEMPPDILDFAESKVGKDHTAIVAFLQQQPDIVESRYGVNDCFHGFNWE